MKLSVEVTGIEEQQLSEAARRLNVTEEDLALAAVRDLLAQREADFDRAAALLWIVANVRQSAAESDD